MSIYTNESGLNCAMVEGRGARISNGEMIESKIE